MEKFSAEVVENVWETPTVFLLRLKRTDGRPLDFVPGQWVLPRIDKDGEDLRRAYSIASPPHEVDYFELCIKAVDAGALSPILAEMREGDVLACSGPYGKFVLVDPLETDVKFVATGTGVAPFKSMIDTLLHKGTTSDILLLFGVRDESQIIYGEHFRDLAEKNDNFTFIPTLSRPADTWKGPRGHVQALVGRYVDGYRNEEVYLCGLPEMVDEVKGMFLDMGSPKDRVHTEKWY